MNNQRCKMGFEKRPLKKVKSRLGPRKNIYDERFNAVIVLSSQ